jgi:colanic acid/amylovoran biosynthesis glycosyltransferase
MRVGYVLRYFPARSETFVAREIAAVGALGVSVTVASLGCRDDVDGAVAVQVPVDEAPRGRRRLWEVPGARPRDLALLRDQRLKDLARLPWLRQVARERRWERVHVHFAGEALETVLAADLGLPVSVTVHAADLFRPRPSLGRLLRRCEVVTVCEHHRLWLARHYGVQARVVRCGVDTDSFVPGPGDDASDGLSVVCVARDVPKKNLDALVRCLPADARLRLVSDAGRLAAPRVQVGALPAEAIAALLQRADVFALPCQIAPDGDRDGVPVALMEAMSCGVPVISTDVSGISELVDDSVGWLVPPHDDAALRRAFHEARDPQVRRKLGEAARKRVVTGWTLGAQALGLHRLWAGVAS